MRLIVILVSMSRVCYIYRNLLLSAKRTLILKVWQLIDLNGAGLCRSVFLRFYIQQSRHIAPSTVETYF